MSVKDKIESILKSVAENKNWSNYEIIPDDATVKGDGFLSEFYTGDVKNNATGELIHTYIKVPPLSGYEFIPDAYANEYHFYAKVFPALDAFQKQRITTDKFEHICKFHLGSIVESASLPPFLVFDNLVKSNYTLYDKRKFMDEDHLKTIFRTYGRYHALTFAFKDQNRETYDELLRPVKFLFPAILNREKMTYFMGVLYRLAYEAVERADNEKATKMKRLLDDLEGICDRGMHYEGRHSSLIHGDCWSNNIMYKYDGEGVVQDMKMIDHQLLCDSTPVHDLSYFFYAAAAKKDLDKLDEYLGLYHESFCDFAKRLGSDPDELLPIDILKSEWKKYAHFGINMALLVWQVKLMPKEQVGEASDGKGEQVFKDHFEQLIKEGKYQNIIGDILLHAIEYNII